MRKLSLLFIAVFSLCSLSGLLAEEIEIAELKLLSPLDETRGWCVDLFAHRKGANPLGGFQGHNCFMYFGEGPTEDQGFNVSQIKNEGKFHLVYWDVCMTLHEPVAGAFVASEKCSGELAQQFEFDKEGRVMPLAAPELCLTLGTRSVPGGGRLAAVGTRPPKSNEKIHLIRRLSFELCSDDRAELQQWGLRNVYAEEERSQPMRFSY